MSRIGKQPISLPQGVKVSIKWPKVDVEGPKGKTGFEFSQLNPVKMSLEDNKEILFSCDSELAKDKAIYGTTRALVANMVTGVSKGFTKVLQLWGVGYNAVVEGKVITLNIGFCHPVKIAVPDKIEVKAERISIEGTNVWQISVFGIDKQKVGQLAAEIRMIRPPEPYKGKGFRYEGEKIIRKAGKSFQSGG